MGYGAVEVVLATLLTWALSLLLLRFGSTFSRLKPYVPLLALAPLVYIPLALILYRREPWARYGLTASHIVQAVGRVLKRKKR